MTPEIDAEQERLELWLSSGAAYHGKRREENVEAWRSYHLEQAERLRRTMEPLIAFHEARLRSWRMCVLSEAKQTKGVVKDETSRDSATV